MAEPQTYPLMSGSLVFKGELEYKPWDEDNPQNSDRANLNGVGLDALLASLHGMYVRITVETASPEEIPSTE